MTRAHEFVDDCEPDLPSLLRGAVGLSPSEILFGLQTGECSGDSYSGGCTLAELTPSPGREGEYGCTRYKASKDHLALILGRGTPDILQDNIRVSENTHGPVTDIHLRAQNRPK